MFVSLSKNNILSEDYKKILGLEYFAECDCHLKMFELKLYKKSHKFDVQRNTNK